MHRRRQRMGEGSRPSAGGRLPLVVVVWLAATLAATLQGDRAGADQPAAPPKPKPANPAEVKRLDTRSEEVRESFLRETTKLIRSYEEVGQLDRARGLLDALRKLDPQNASIKTKMDAFDQQILDAQEFEFEIEPGAAWQAVGMVAGGRTVRILVTGDYKMSGMFSIGPDGMPTDDPAEGLVAGVPLGGVMGVVSSVGATATGAGQKPSANPQNEKPPKPFAVGGKHQKPAERDGMLYLKVNVPPGSRCTGRLTARISGVTRGP